MTGDREPFEEWYTRLHPRVALGVTAAYGDIDLAADATDESFVRAFAQWSEVAAMQSPDGWVFRVAFNVAARRQRRRAIERSLLRRDRVPEVDGPAGELWALVAELPPRQRQAVVLRHVGQFHEAEIAHVMRISRGTVSATLRAAYRRLRSDLEREPMKEFR